MRSVWVLLTIILLLVSSSAWAQGGHDGDYSNIPRLKWAGPGQPGTYDEYMRGKEVGPTLIEQVYTSSRAGRLDRALVLVNPTLAPGIQAGLDLYISDLEDDGYAVDVYTTLFSTDVAAKNFILSQSTDLRGCVFIGDQPQWPWFEMEVWGHEEFPCDLYFMDLDGAWADADSDGMWDSHTGDVEPEIFVGHIDASMMTGNEADITNHYFSKNHAYRTGQFTPPAFGLTYTEDDWASFSDMRTDIKYAYPDFEDIPAPATNRDDYMDNRVPNASYEFIQLACHSSSELHAFTRGGYAYNYQVKNAQPQAMFYNLFCCSTLRFTDSNFLGGAYIYDTSNTSVAVIGSTKTGSMLEFYAFYQPFGQYKTFGESFRQWFDYLAPYNSEEMAWHYGMTIAGDPFLTLREPSLFIDFPSGLPSGHYPPGIETKVTLEIEAGSESYVPGSGKVHYRFDPADPYAEAPVTPLGNDLFEAVIPNTRPGDEPQFYFTASGDGGGTVLSPGDAPDTVYSFDVCFVELLVEDDLETASGWTVESTAITTGEWERADPEGTSDGGTAVQPENDHSSAGTHCFVTQAAAGGNYYAYDVDGGPTRLISPVYDLSAGDAIISFYIWFYHSSSGTVEPCDIHVTNNGFTWVKAMSISHANTWTQYSFKVSDYVIPNDKIQIRITADDEPNDSVVEAAFDDLKIERINADPSLWANGYSIPVSAGAVIDFSFDAGSVNASRNYLLLGSVSGTEPGYPLPGGAVLPLNWDVFTDLVMALLATPVCKDFLGKLNASGEASATLNTLGPLNPAAVGVTAHFAYALGGPFDFTSNAMPIVFDP